MATFDLEDNETGLKIRVNGESMPTEDDMPQLFAAARKDAEEQLSTGKFKQNADFSEVDKATERKRIQQLSAAALGVSSDNVDIDSGMSFWNRTKLSMQPTDADKMKQLEDTYGKDGVAMLDVGGTSKMFFRDPDSKKMTMVDEQGASFADFTADIAGSALPIAGAVGAAVATGGASIPLMAGAAALGGLAAGVGQDTAVRAASDEDLRLGESFKRRGIEAAIGVPIDLVTGVGGRFVSKAIGKRTIERGAAELTSELDGLAARLGGDVNLTAAQETSTDQSLKQSIRAGIDPEGREAAAYGLQRDEISKLSKVLRGEEASIEPIEDVMQNVADRQFKLIDAYEQRVAKMDAQRIDAEALAKNQTEGQKRSIKQKLTNEREVELKAMRDQAEAGIKKLTKGRQRLESTMGDDIRNQQAAGLAKNEAINKDLYERAYSLTDTQQANTPVSAVQKVLSRIDDEALAPDSPELTAVKLLRKRIADNPEDLTFRELDRFVRGVTDKVNYKKKYNVTQTEFQLQKIGKKLDKLVDDAAGPPTKLGGRGAGKAARDAHRAARKNYKNKMLPFFDGDRAANLSSVAGGSAGAVGARGENVLARTFATRAAVKDSIDSGVSLGSLKKSYLDKIINDAGGGEIKFDKNVLAELYKTSKGGSAKAISDIDAINRALKSGKGKANITADEVKMVMEGFEPKARAKALRAIAEKSKTEKKLAAARKNVLSKVAKGEMPAPEDIHHFIGDISKLKPGQIQKLMDRLPSDRARKSLSRSGYDALLEKAGAKSAKAQRSGKATGREALWEPETMHTILNNSAERAQWESLIGKDAVADLEVLNKWLLSSAEIRDTAKESIGRFVTSTGASGTPNMLFVSPQLPRWIGRKMLSVIHTSPLTRMMLKRSLKESNVDQNTINKLFYTAMGTRRGMDAITDEMAKDPTFSAYVQESMKVEEQPSQAAQAPR